MTTTTTTMTTVARAPRADRALVTTLFSAGYPPAIARQRVASGPDALAWAIAAHCPFIEPFIERRSVDRPFFDRPLDDRLFDDVETPFREAMP